jgi:hypothetical protein
MVPGTFVYWVVVVFRFADKARVFADKLKNSPKSSQDSLIKPKKGPINQNQS